MKKISLTIFILLLILIQNLAAQEKPDSHKKSNGKTIEESEEDKENKVVPWNFGINIGGYYANKYYAAFYNGSFNNINRVYYVMSNYYWYQDIKNDLGASDTVLVLEYPANMHYNLSMMGGVFIRYNFNMNWGICMDVNYTKLIAEDAVTFQVDPSSQYFEDIRLIPIRGVEQRVHLDLMAQRNFRLKSKIYFFLQGGLNLNFTKVLQSSIFVAEKEYNMINIYGSQAYVPGLSLQEYAIDQGGVGYGLMAAGGAGVPLTDLFGLEPGFFVNFNNVNLEGYSQFNTSFGFYLRILFGNILPRPDPE
jgi:hypothetical protein